MTSLFFCGHLLLSKHDSIQKLWQCCKHSSMWYPGSIPGSANKVNAGAQRTRSAGGPATLMSC